MAETEIIKVKDGEKVIEYEQLLATDAENVDIYLPCSIESMELSVLKNSDGKTVRVFYDGTIAEWQKIKKGGLKKITVNHDWYGYYYHNAPIQSTEKEEYYNWICYCKSVKVICSDGEFYDDENENKLNPARVSSSSYWDDEP